MVWSILIECQQPDDEATTPTTISGRANESDNPILLTNYNHLMSRLGVTINPSYPSHLDELNQIELEAPIKGYLNKLVSRKWFTPLWLNNINSKNTWRTTYCILRANKLYYYQNQLALGFDKKYCGQINLDYYDVCEPLNSNNTNNQIKDDDKGDKFIFLIDSSLASVSSSSSSSQSRHIFAADSAFEMFKWISSIQNAIKDARANRKGPGRRRNDKLKSGQDAIEASSKQKNTTSVDGGLTLTTERVTSILHCEQKNRPKGPKGRRLPGRTNLHSTLLNGNSTSELFDRHSLTTSGSDHLFGFNSQSLSLESSTDMSTETSTNHNNFHHLRRPRAITNETPDNVDAGDNGDELKEVKESEDEDEESNKHKDKYKEEPVVLRIIGILNKKRMEEEEDINQRERSLLISNGLDKGDNLSHENNHHHFNPSRLSNGGSNGNSPVSTIKSSTSPSPIKRFHDKNHLETKDLKRHLNAIFSNNNQHNQQQQLTINLGDSIVTLDQVKLSACLKEIAPTLSTSNTLLNESSSLSSSLSNFNPQLKELIKEMESLKYVKKTKNLNTKLQTVIGKLVTLSDDYSKSIESFDHYNNQVTKLISSLSTLASQSKTATTTTTTPTTPTGPIVSPPSPSSLSPPSSPRLVNTNPIKLLNSNKTNLPTAHC